MIGATARTAPVHTRKITEFYWGCLLDLGEYAQGGAHCVNDGQLLSSLHLTEAKVDGSDARKVVSRRARPGYRGICRDAGGHSRNRCRNDPAHWLERKHSLFRSRQFRPIACLVTVGRFENATLGVCPNGPCGKHGNTHRFDNVRHLSHGCSLKGTFEG